MIYIERLKKNKIDPNFWCSSEYFHRAGLQITIRDGYAYVFDGDRLMFPPLSEAGFREEYPEPVWSDFPGYQKPGAAPEFLDLEYIYDPAGFLTMEGGDWATFRKNVRKWPNRVGARHEYSPLKGVTKEELEALFISWLEPREEEIHDDETMLDYLLNGKDRWGLFTDDGVLRGVNIFDTNHRFINYRYCICRPEPFLSEYLRLRFYQTAWRMGALVNDGGVLGNPALKTFKDRLHPIWVREVHSWGGTQ